MRRIVSTSIISLLLFLFVSLAQAQAPSAGVVSIDAVIKALYEGIGFKPSGISDWERLRTLFDPGARLIPPAGPDSIIVLSFEEFALRSTRYAKERGIKAKGFSEREVARRTENFGNIAHIWSTYESRYTPEDPVPFSRGINSIQLIKQGGRWWIVTILWDAERPGNQIPEKYLGKRK